MSEEQTKESPPTQRENLSDENRYFGGLVGNKEIFVMTIIAAALYLIEGKHAKFVCTALTSVPPAIFSYKVLMSPKSTKEGYQSILFYWILYGLLAVIDQLIGTSQGYNLVKGGLLGSVFLYAFLSNPHAVPYSWYQTVLPSILTRYDSQGFCQQTASPGFEARPPTITQFSDVDELDYMPTRRKEIGNVVITEGLVLRCDSEKLKDVKMMNLVDELFSFHRILVGHDPNVADVFTKKMSSGYWHARIQPEHFLMTMDMLFLMTMDVAMMNKPGASEHVIELEFVFKKLGDFLNNYCFTLNDKARQLLLSQQSKAEEYPFADKSSVSHVVSYLIERL